jgi:hypothetical protein
MVFLPSYRGTEPKAAEALADFARQFDAPRRYIELRPHQLGSQAACICTSPASVEFNPALSSGLIILSAALIFVSVLRGLD